MACKKKSSHLYIYFLLTLLVVSMAAQISFSKKTVSQDQRDFYLAEPFKISTN